MSTANLTALIAALTALVGAVAGLVGVVRHVTGPAHQDPPAPSSVTMPPVTSSGYATGGSNPSTAAASAPPDVPHP